MEGHDAVMASRSLQDVIALIEATFADVTRDEDCTLHQAQLADQSMSREISPEEWDAEKLHDPENDWRDVPARSLDECSAALSHASPPELAVLHAGVHEASARTSR